MSFENPTGSIWRTAGKAIGAAALGVMLATPAQAVRFKLADGAIDGSFDTTIGWGLNMRTRSHNPTRADGLAGMLGNRSVAKWEVFNHTIKASHDLSLTGDKWGVFVRGNYFYDFDAAHEVDNLPNPAENKKIHNGEFTDAYVYFRFGGDDQFNLRLGKQVISWGENTFIGNSINDINTVDLTKLRVPGVELKDAFIGTPAAYFQWQINDAWSMDVFQLFAFDEFRADPAGAFFLTNDAFGDGNAGFRDPLTGACAAPDGPRPAGAGLGFTAGICDGGDELASDSGQWGIALRYYAADWGNGVDLGFYYQNLHDHIFKLGAIAGGPGIAPTYFRWFPEDIERWGVSWNTTLGSWAWGGEYAYRRNMKLQGDASAILLNATGIAPVPPLTVAPGTAVDNLNPLAPSLLTPGTKFKEETVRDYGHHRIQMTFQRLWGPMPEFKADQWNTIFEVVHGWNTSMPGQSTFDRFDENISNNYQGFRGRSSLTYNNALFNSVNVTFKQAFNWDIRGNAPTFGGNKEFIEDRKVVSLGLDFDYRLRWKWGVSLTHFFDGVDDYTTYPGRGAGGSSRAAQDNASADRDFLAFHASYTF